MTAGQSPEYLAGLIRELCKLPRETEWVEFKGNNASAASRLLNEAVVAGLVVIEDPAVGTRARTYLPHWAGSGARPGEIV